MNKTSLIKIFDKSFQASVLLLIYSLIPYTPKSAAVIQMQQTVEMSSQEKSQVASNSFNLVCHLVLILFYMTF